MPRSKRQKQPGKRRDPMAGAPNSSDAGGHHPYQPPPFEPSRRNHGNHALPPRPPFDVDSYRPSYEGGPNVRPMSSYGGSQQNFSTYAPQQSYSQGDYSQGGYSQGGYQQGGYQQGPYDQGRQRNGPDWYQAPPPPPSFGQNQPFQQAQQSYTQQRERPFGRGRRQGKPYSEWWDDPAGPFDGRGNGHGPLEGGGVALSRNDRYDRYENGGNRGQSIPNGPRGDTRYARKDYDDTPSIDRRRPAAVVEREEGAPWPNLPEKRKSKKKKDKERRGRSDERPAYKPVQQKFKGESVLPVPKPTEDYLALAESHLPDDPSTKKLLVLDLNDALVHRTAPNREGKRSVRPRPFLNQFLDYIFANFTVMVWSSARPHNVTDMVTGSFSKKHREQLVAIWSRENFGLKPEHYNMKIVTYKNLEMVWEKIAHPEADDGKRWDQTNTVLIDDSVEKACAQPHNHLLIDVWDNPNRQARDRTLLDIIGYLEKVIRPSGNVSEAMRECKYQPGTGKWEDYIPSEAKSEPEPEAEAEGEIGLEDEEEAEAVKSAVEEEIMDVEEDLDLDVAPIDDDTPERDDEDHGGIRLRR